MNNLNPDFIRAYCIAKFSPDYRISGDDSEMIIPSIFIEYDHKMHMSINLETGLWRCFKTSNKGNFLHLYSILECCSYRAAYEKFLFESFIRGPSKSGKVSPRPEFPTEEVKKFIPVDVNKCSTRMNSLAADYILSRGLQDFKFMVAEDGFYGGRLIIPFNDRKNQMFFFQGRTLLQREPKYLNCKSSRMSDILYPFAYESDEPLYITEGVFDALTLNLAGLNATCTMSASVSNTQMRQLKYYPGKLVVAFDHDNAGFHGIRQFMERGFENKIQDLYYCLPFHDYKDWNSLYMNENIQSVKDFAKNIQKLNKVTCETIGL